MLGTMVVQQALGAGGAQLFGVFVYLPVLMALVQLAASLRKWACELEGMHTIAQGFDMRNAACFDESDRVFVQTNVLKVMFRSGFVSVSASDEDALDTFNLTVREKLPVVLNKALGSSLLRYRYAVLL